MPNGRQGLPPMLLGSLSFQGDCGFRRDMIEVTFGNGAVRGGGRPGGSLKS